jgi:Na+/phosphate symporter
MDIAEFLKSLAESGLAARIRDSLFLFPLLESTHVIGLALVFGTIAIIDLRLLGLASAQRSFQRMASDILKWTWGAFALTALTGALMFTTNAPVYYHNFFFRTKMLLLALTGINMLVFELTAGRTIHAWDKAPAAPPAGKAVAVLSLVMWIGVIFMGRLIGFTTSRAAVAPPPPAGVNFEDFLNGTPDSGGRTTAPPPRNK